MFRRYDITDEKDLRDAIRGADVWDEEQSKKVVAMTSSR